MLPHHVLSIICLSVSTLWITYHMLSSGMLEDIITKTIYCMKHILCDITKRAGVEKLVELMDSFLAFLGTENCAHHTANCILL